MTKGLIMERCCSCSLTHATRIRGFYTCWASSLPMGPYLETNFRKERILSRVVNDCIISRPLVLMTSVPVDKTQNTSRSLSPINLLESTSNCREMVMESQLYVSALSWRFLSPRKCLGFTLPYSRLQHMCITPRMEKLGSMPSSWNRYGSRLTYCLHNF